MGYYEDQAAEIQTIKPRVFTLNLSDADVKRLYEKAYSNGVTPAELLEGFIGDLTDGTYSNGSDEREQANSYFDRCSYRYMGDYSFLQWALEWDRLDEISYALDTIEDTASDLAHLDTDSEDARDLLDMQNEAENELKAMYDEYMASNGAQTYSDGIAVIRRYLSELRAMTERGMT